MITVTTNRFDYIEIEGHAGYAPHGSDIVCASVSVLYETMKNVTRGRILNVEEDDKLCRISTDKRSKEFDSNYMHFFLKGIEGIAEAYPDHVQLIIDR